MAVYRDPLPGDQVYSHEPALDALGPERAAYWRQREDDEYASPRWFNTSAANLRADYDTALFAKLDRLQATLERLVGSLDRSMR